MSTATRTDLVLEGGGVKGIGLVGAICRLARAGYRFDRVAGASAGAVVAALLAATERSGDPIVRMEETVREIDYTRFRDPGLLPRLGAGGKALQLALHEGLYEGDYLTEWLTDRLARLGVRTFGDLRREGVAYDAPMRNRYHLVVVAADISRRQIITLPWDYPRYGLDPDQQPVAQAVRASASIPFFFEPVVLRSASGKGASTLVDGGLLWNFPLDIFDVPEPGLDLTTTIGIKLSAKEVLAPPASPSDGVFGVAYDCLATLLGSHERYHISNSGAEGRIVFVNTGGVSAIDFEITRDQQDRLFDSGVSAASRWLAHRAPGARKVRAHDLERKGERV